ncbi:tyrosine-type recombinase/integrase [Streptomyces parvulus]|uniref:Tyrosine-type recombinase/integrase n=2 Tax=Streptomyces parvulus TaxID=146923 RepID=A0ABV5DFS1_9ACTN
MGSFFKDCGCARPTRCPHPYTIRFRNGLGKQVEEGGFGTQDDAIDRLTQIYAEKKRTAPSVAEARRELGQKSVAEYAKQWLPRQRRMTAYSTGEHVNSTEPMERRRVRALFEKLPVVDGMGMYGFRHYFASNALGSGIPITDVAEWMGHKSIEETYRTYRHLMPGSITKAARILNAGLRDAV